MNILEKILIFLIYGFVCYHVVADQLKLSDKEIFKYRDVVKQMFYHAYNGYMTYAFPYDELRPLTCDGHDTWGSYSLTLIDALDTLAVLENKTEFQKVINLITERTDFEADINVSVFETNIRIIGGLLSGHLLYRRMGIKLEKGWPCEGPLLRLATDAATRLLPAFDTPTGMPYGTVNLKYGVPEGETPVTCSAGVGTFVVEFGTLSRLTGKKIFEEVALKALHALWQRRSQLDLIGNHIDVLTGSWIGHDSGIGAGIDSFFEYLVKGSFLLQRPELMSIFNVARKAIDLHLKHEDWFLWKSMQRGQITMAVFQSLEAFWPGVLTLVGDIESAQKTIFNYHQVVKQYGFTPEFYNIPQAAAYTKRGGYPLRPEFVESLMYLYQATGDHVFLKMGADVIHAIEHSAKTSCGYATVENVVDHSLANRMESFFLAETTKYLYLLFHEDHWLHVSGKSGRPRMVDKRLCIIESGYFYNTEAHPMDTGALNCCSGPEDGQIFLPPDDLSGLILDPFKQPTKKINLKKKKSVDKDYHIAANLINSKVDENAQIIGAISEINKVGGEDANIGRVISEINKVGEESSDGVNSNIMVQAGRNPDASVDNSQVKLEDEKNTLENKLKRRLKEYIKKINDMFDDVKKNEIKEILPSLSEVVEQSADKANKVPKSKESENRETKFSKTDVNYLESVIENYIINKNVKYENIETILTENETIKQYESDEVSMKEDIDKQKITLDPKFVSTEDLKNKLQQPVSYSYGVATSVSSSKFTTSSTQGENRIIQKTTTPSVVTKSTTIKPFCLKDFEERISLDMTVLKNITTKVSYQVLSCPAPSFLHTLIFKGQMVSVEP